MRYVWSQSQQGSPGVLNPATFNPVGSGDYTAQSLSATNANMDAGVFLQIVLKNARGKLIHSNPAWIQPMPLTGGHKPVATYFKWGEIDFANGTALEADPTVFKLAEGITPQHNLKMSVTTEQIAPEAYGLVTYWTDTIGATSFINFKTQLVERLGWGLGRIIDAISRLHLKANLTSTTLPQEPAGPLTWKKLVRLRSILNSRDIAPPQSEGDKYPMLVHDVQLADMLMDPDIKASMDYTGKLIDQLGNMHPAVIGEAAGFRFYSTTRCTVYPDAPAAQTGYRNFVIGRDLIASTELKAPDVGDSFNLGSVFGMGGFDGPGGYGQGNNATWPVRMIEKGFGSGGATGDPLDQIASVGMKATFALKIIQPTHGMAVIVESDYMP